MTNDFRNGDTWRVFRIMAEFVEGIEEMAASSPAVAIFGSARAKPDNPFYIKARELARRLGESGFNIITGGGPGIMEAANRGAQEGKTQSIGLGIDLPREQGFNPYVDKSVGFRYFFVRKVMFLKYSDAIVICPGGFGTMDEMFETLTLIQTHKIPWKPVVLLGVEWFSGLLDFLKKTMLDDSGFISPNDLEKLFLVTDDLDETIDFISRHHLDQDGKKRFQLNSFEYMD